ncbi:hypothetical protein Gotri_012980, partial [Gossypium trilobum]|nr:hypothetical protein [Gossypium trilobum]
MEERLSNLSHLFRRSSFMSNQMPTSKVFYHLLHQLRSILRQDQHLCRGRLLDPNGRQTTLTSLEQVH